MAVNAPVTARFALIDHYGHPVTEVDYRGRFALVYFGFTHCKVVCPRSLAKLSAVLARVDADMVTALYVTVDPERDTPDAMRSYLEGGYPRFTGLTGSRGSIDEAKRNFRVFAERRDEPDGYQVPHTAIAYLLDREGNYVTHFPESVDEDRIVERLTALIEEHPANA